MPPTQPPSTRRKTLLNKQLRFEILEQRCVLDASLPVGLPTAFGSAEAFDDYAIDAAVERHREWFGRNLGDYWIQESGSFIDIDLPVVERAPQWTQDRVEATSTLLATMPALERVIGTNLQELGVDEADQVKTDGRHLFVVSGSDVAVVDASLGGQLEELARIDVAGDAMLIYLHGERLTVISTEYIFATWGGGGIGNLAASTMLAPGKQQTTVTVLDVSDADAPNVVSETAFDGSYLTSRAVGAHVYLVVQNFMPGMSAPELVGEGESRAYESEGQYRQRLMQNPPHEMLPQFRTATADGVIASGDITAPADVIALEDQGSHLVSIVSMDVTAAAPQPLDTLTLLDDYTSIAYVSLDNLYLVSHDYDSQEPLSDIVQIEFEQGDLELDAQGAVPGHLLNQFAIDEHDGYVRVATTVQTWSQLGGESSNHVFVLAEQDDALEVVGSIEDIAVGERIFSVRFEGDRGHLVTFRQIDPLFTLDLSDPTNPKILGELEMPGVSRYLQSLSDELLLGIGRAGDANGLINTLQISLFDVSDPTHPRIVDRFDLPQVSWWGGSLIERDHHAVTYLAEEGKLILSLGNDGSMIFDIDAASGFTLVAHVLDDVTIERSIVINDLLYSIGSGVVSVRDLDAPSDELDRIWLQPLPADYPLPIEPGPGDTPLPVEPGPVIWWNGLETPVTTEVVPLRQQLGGSPQVPSEIDPPYIKTPFAPPLGLLLAGMDGQRLQQAVDAVLSGAADELIPLPASAEQPMPAATSTPATDASSSQMFAAESNGEPAEPRLEPSQFNSQENLESMPSLAIDLCKW